MKSILTFLILPTFFLLTNEISMLGIKIGDTKASLEKIKLKVEAKDDEMIKYRTDDGNDLSVTLNQGKIVYMENDWLQDTNARKPLYTDFQFGQTSLREIRKKFGTNGFTYKTRRAFTTKTDLIGFNCFELESPNNKVLVVITKISLKEKPT